MAFFNNSTTTTMSFLQELTSDQLREHVGELNKLADYHTVVTLARDIYGHDAPWRIALEFEGNSNDEGGMYYTVSSWTVLGKDGEECVPDLEAPFWHKPFYSYSTRIPFEDLEEKLEEREKESWQTERKQREYARQQQQRHWLQGQWKKEQEQQQKENQAATGYSPYFRPQYGPFWRPAEPVTPHFGHYAEETNHLYEAKRIELREQKGIEWPEIPLAPAPTSCPLYAEDTRDEVLQELAVEMIENDDLDFRGERLSGLDEDHDEFIVDEPPAVKFPKVYAMIPTNDPDNASVITKTLKLGGSSTATGTLTLNKVDVTLDAKDMNPVLSPQKEPLAPEALINYLSNAWGGQDATRWDPLSTHIEFTNWMSACLFMRLCFPLEAQVIDLSAEDQSYYDDEGDYRAGPTTLDSIHVYTEGGKELFPDIEKPLCKYLFNKQQVGTKHNLADQMKSYNIYREMLNDDNLSLTVPVTSARYDITKPPIPVFPKILIP